jgi:aminopeptidase N
MECADMNENVKYAYSLMGEEFKDHDAQTASEIADRVRFSLKKGDISISATVSAAYFDANVLPILTTLLGELSSPADEKKGRDHPMPKPETFRREQIPTMREIIEMLGANSGPELVRAAAVSLSIFQDTPIFSREQLLEEAEKAVGHWHKNHAKTASAVLDYLMASGCLVERANGDLCLSPIEEKAAILAMRSSCA